MSKDQMPGAAKVVTLEPTSQEPRAAVRRNNPADTEYSLFSRPEPLDASGETREGRRERHRRETFERLVDAARTILFKRELDQVTVQDITEAADVGKGTFFNYFRSKEHVVSRLLAGRSSIWTDTLERVRCGQQSAPQALLELARGYLLPENGEWLTYENNLMQALASVEVRGVLSRQVAEFLKSYEALMLLGQEQGTIRKDLPSRELATFAHTFFSGFTVMLWIHRTPPTPALVDETMSWLVKVLEPGGPAVFGRASAPRRDGKARKRRLPRQTRRPGRR